MEIFFPPAARKLNNTGEFQSIIYYLSSPKLLEPGIIKLKIENSPNHHLNPVFLCQ